MNSNGAAYADLDNDGDLDLILNNQGDIASVYRNNSTKNRISFSFRGPEKNTFGIGVKVFLLSEIGTQFKQLEISRGFQSGVSHKLHFGLDSLETVHMVKVVWPDGKQEIAQSLQANQQYEIEYSNAATFQVKEDVQSSIFENLDVSELGIDFQQKENNFNDYDLQLLLPQKQSEKSKALAVADVNNDGLEDFFVGNARGASGALFLQKNDGTFLRSNEGMFENDKVHEDTSAFFFDSDNDGDLDLFVSSGGYEVEQGSNTLADRLYLNNGKGNFSKSTSLPSINTSTQIAVNGDIDNDGIDEIFIGGGVQHGRYPLSEGSYFLKMEAGKYKKYDLDYFGDFSELNMLNDAKFVDVDRDSDLDLVVVGEWMPIKIYSNENGKFNAMSGTLFEEPGWFQSITAGDINNDGYLDLLVGNYGLNNKFKPSKEKPLHIYADYLDDNDSFDVVLSKVSKTGDLLPVRGRECSTQQVPKLGEEVKSFKQFASLTLPDIYGEENLQNATHFTATNLQTFVLLNDTEGGFKKLKTPSEVQFGPTLNAVSLDIDNNGIDEFIGLGIVNEAEVETIKYDASRGYVISCENSKMQLVPSSPFTHDEARAIETIQIKGTKCLLILNKNSELGVLQLK